VGLLRCAGPGDVPAVPRRRGTGSATPTTLAPGATTPRGSASSCSPTTKQTPRTRQKLATERFPQPGNWTSPGCGAKRASPLTTEGRRHQRAAGPSARA
jgi:hypothetical protein